MLSLREKKYINGQIKERSCAVFEQPAVITGNNLFNIFFTLTVCSNPLFVPAFLDQSHFVLLLSLQINVFTNKRGWASFDGDEYTRDFKLLKYNPTECLRSVGKAEF